MRLDLFLKWSRLIPRRTLAKATCDAGRVKINGQAARAGHEVRGGDVIALRQPFRDLTVRVCALPTRAPGKDRAAEMFEVLEARGRDRQSG